MTPFQCLVRMSGVLRYEGPGRLAAPFSLAQGTTLAKESADVFSVLETKHDYDQHASLRATLAFGHLANRLCPLATTMY